MNKNIEELITNCMLSMASHVRNRYGRKSTSGTKLKVYMLLKHVKNMKKILLKNDHAIVRNIADDHDICRYFVRLILVNILGSKLGSMIDKIHETKFVAEANGNIKKKIF